MLEQIDRLIESLENILEQADKVQPWTSRKRFAEELMPQIVAWAEGRQSSGSISFRNVSRSVASTPGPDDAAYLPTSRGPFSTR